MFHQLVDIQVSLLCTEFHDERLLESKLAVGCRLSDREKLIVKWSQFYMSLLSYNALVNVAFFQCACLFIYLYRG